MRKPSGPERRLQESGLPRELARLVLETVRRTRLWRGEREDVTEELIAHLREGLAAGRSPERLTAEFGDPARAAELITRARRRMRPLAWRAGLYLGRAGAVAVAVGLAIYAISAVRLYSAAPAVSFPGVVVDGDAVVWPGEAETIRALSDSAHGALTRAAEAAALGESVGALKNLRFALDAVSALEASPTLAGHLAALDARAAVYDALASIIDGGEAKIGTGEGADVRGFALHLLAEETGDGHDGLRAGLGLLLDRIYAPNGGLTGQGLRLLQAMMGKTDPGAGALALEPAYFAFPAHRDEVEAEADRLLALAGTGQLAQELETLRSSPVASLRFIPVTLVMPAVAAALERADVARGRLEGALAEQHSTGDGGSSLPITDHR